MFGGVKRNLTKTVSTPRSREVEHIIFQNKKKIRESHESKFASAYQQRNKIRLRRGDISYGGKIQTHPLCSIPMAPK